MIIEKISQDEMMHITGGGLGCWIGKIFARLVAGVSCGPTNAAAVCYEVMKIKQEDANEE